MTEHDIQNLIRLNFSRNYPDSLLFRANVGRAWTGSRVKRNSDGSITIYDPRPFETGLPKGFSDLFGIMPGGQALFVEVKTDRGKPSEDQIRFLRTVSGLGCPAGIARSFEDVVQIIKNGVK